MTTMNTPKHTPGPWKVEPGINHIKVWGERPKTGPSLIAEVRNEGTAHSTSGAREQANAVLIAAAPAMYEALKDLLGELGDLHDGSISELQCHWCGRYYDDLPSGSLCPSDDCPGYKARAALAQAEGTNR